MQQIAGAFRSLPKPSRRTKGSVGIGTSSGGRCMSPDFSARSCARSLKPAAQPRDLLVRLGLAEARELVIRRGFHVPLFGHLEGGE